MDLGADGMLLVGGEGPSRQTLEGLVGSVRYVIAADSGFDLALRLKLVPDLLVGDLDSVSSSARLESFPGQRVERYPADKEETDTEIGLRLFRQMGFRRVALVGGGAGRLDHLLGILALFERDYHPLFWLTAAEHVQPIEGEFQFEGWQGQTVSFFPLGEGAGT